MTPNERIASLTPADIRDFMEQVQIPGPWSPALHSYCWQWTGIAHRFGRWKGLAAHRVTWYVYHGWLPPDKRTHITQFCGNPLCVNPTHLRATANPWTTLPFGIEPATPYDEMRRRDEARIRQNESWGDYRRRIARMRGE